MKEVVELYNKKRTSFDEAVDAALDAIWNNYSVRCEYDGIAYKMASKEAGFTSLHQLVGKHPKRLNSLQIKGIFEDNYRSFMVRALQTAQAALTGKSAEELFVPSLRVVWMHNDRHEVEFWHHRDEPPLMVGAFSSHSEGVAWLRSNARRLLSEAGVSEEKADAAVIFV